MRTWGQHIAKPSGRLRFDIIREQRGSRFKGQFRPSPLKGRGGDTMSRHRLQNRMQVLKILGLLIVAGILIFAGLVIFKMAPKIGPLSPLQPQAVIANFDECAAAGNPVMESYPRQCRTQDGRLFVEEVTPAGGIFPAQGEGIVFNSCAVAGCSQQLCVSADEASTIVTTCEYRAEYACYKEASCEPQADGKCGWTLTPELQRCLANPPAMDSELEVK